MPAGTRGHGDTGTRGRGDTGTRGRKNEGDEEQGAGEKFLPSLPAPCSPASFPCPMPHAPLSKFSILQLNTSQISR
ncbi:MAG: hypothetical protein RMY29_032090 [Nostoc sp. CreGUA01]|nr:hypothetical protein [Nostoc sp. CreGUA01]